MDRGEGSLAPDIPMDGAVNQVEGLGVDVWRGV